MIKQFVQVREKRCGLIYNVTHEINIFGLFWQINEILYEWNFLALRYWFTLRLRATFFNRI